MFSCCGKCPGKSKPSKTFLNKIDIYILCYFDIFPSPYGIKARLPVALFTKSSNTKACYGYFTSCVMDVFWVSTYTLFFKFCAWVKFYNNKHILLGMPKHFYSKLFLPQHLYTCSPYCVLYISHGADMENCSFIKSFFIWWSFSLFSWLNVWFITDAVRRN